MTIENQTTSQPTSTSSSSPEISQTTPTPETTTPSFDLNSFFPEDIRKDADFERLSKNFPKDLQAIAKDYYHKNKHFGKARDVVKAEIEAELKATQQFKPEDYQIQLPEGYAIEDNIINAAKTKALELGIKPELAQQFLNSIFEADKQESIQLEKKEFEANKQALENIKKEWGFEYEERASKARKTLPNYVSQEDIATIESLPFSQKIIIDKIMDKVASKVGEGSIGGNPSSISPKEQYDAILKNKDHPYHKGDLKAVNEVFELLKKIQ
jgi:hypothetical protein